MSKTPPQVRVPTDLYEKLFFCDLKGNHLKVTLLVARFQFGFNRLKYCACKRTEMTCIGLDPSTITKIVSELIKSKIIIENQDGFTINTDLDDWELPQRINADIPRYKSLITLHAHKQAELIKRQEKADLPWPD